MVDSIFEYESEEKQNINIMEYKTKTEKPFEIKEKDTRHLQIAEQFAHEMMNSFNSQEQNEILQHVKHIFQQERMIEIEKVEARLSFLKETLKTL
jgi:hypothetical protein